MKKIASLCLLGAVLTACNSSGNQEFEITGNLSDSTLNGQSIFLMAGDTVTDSTLVQNNRFAFAGQTDSTSIFSIAKKVAANGKTDFEPYTRLIVKQGSKVAVNIADNVVVDDNNGDNHKWSTFQNDFKKKFQNMRDNYMQLVTSKVAPDSLNHFIEKEEQQLENLWKEAAKKYSDTPAGAAIFSDFCTSVDNYAEFLDLTKNLKYSYLFPDIQKARLFFQNRENTAEGKAFVDFTGKDLEGNAVRLSDFVGKGQYVLVDFWASWCGPCRREIPNLLQVNKQFKGKQFMVLGINVWDNEENFRKAYKEEKMDYPQMFTTEDDKATHLYGINSIPQIILFAPDGKIIKRDLRGEAIAATVKEYLKM